MGRIEERVRHILRVNETRWSERVRERPVNESNENVCMASCKSMISESICIACKLVGAILHTVLQRDM